MEQNTPTNSSSETKADGSANGPHSLSGQRRWAKLSYRLACVGPLALLLVAICVPHSDARTPPTLLEQIFWAASLGCSPMGVILGLVLFSRFRAGTLGARKMGVNYALAAIVVGVLATLSLAFEVPMISSIRHPHRYDASACSSNLRQIGVGLRMYVQDYDEYYPSTAAWNDDIEPYTKNKQALFCPSAPQEEQKPTYALNSQLLGISDSTLQDQEKTVTFFDSVPGKNLVGGRELLSSPARHYDGQNIGFVDGHVRWANKANLTELLWKPHVETQAEKLLKDVNATSQTGPTP